MIIIDIVQKRKQKIKESWRDIITKDFLIKELLENKKFVIDVSKIVGCKANDIYSYLRRYNIMDDYKNIKRNKICKKCNKEFCANTYAAVYCSKKCKNNSHKITERGKQYYKKYQQERNNIIRQDIFIVYGDSCVCCRENNKKFLTLDHKNNDGHIDRKLYNNNLSRLYKEAIDVPDFEKYQILCMNCNWGKSKNNGICPHKEGVLDGKVWG